MFGGFSITISFHFLDNMNYVGMHLMEKNKILDFHPKKICKQFAMLSNCLGVKVFSNSKR